MFRRDKARQGMPCLYYEMRAERYVKGRVCFWIAVVILLACSIIFK